MVSCNNSAKDNTLDLDIPNLNETNTPEREDPDSEPSSIPSIEPIQEVTAVTIYLPTLNKNTDYTSWSKYFNSKYNLNLSVSTFTNFKYDLDSEFATYTEPVGFVTSDESIVRNGIYLYNAWSY